VTATTPADEATRPGDPSTPAWLPLAAVGVTLLLWASAFVAIRHLAGAFTPGSLSLGRLVVGSLCLGAVALGRGLPRPTGRQWLSIVVIGVLWFGIYNVALNAGEHHVDAGTAVMLIQISPVLVALLAATFLHERFTLYLGLGLALAFGGVALIATASGGSSGDRSVLGVVLCLLSAVVYSISLGLRHLVGGLPGCLPDRDRLHHVRLRAAHHVGEQPRRDDLPRPAHHDRDGLAVPRRDPARDGLHRRRARPGRRGGGPAQAADAGRRAARACLTPTGSAR
jgi:uncharacterized membrane protein